MASNRPKRPNRINPTMLTGTQDKYPYQPTGTLVCGPQGATRLAWNDSGCWFETRADQTLLDHGTESFAGELMTPAQAAELADELGRVARSMKKSSRVLAARIPGKFIQLVPVDDLLSVGVSRPWAVLVTDADGVAWFRTHGIPMDQSQTRALAICVRRWAREENRRQELAEMRCDQIETRRVQRSGGAV